MRPTDLQDAIRRPGHGNALIQALALLTEAWALGKLPESHGPWLCCANLTPLKKSDGGVRPVAVGETLRRVVGKALLASGRTKQQIETLQPLQVGVGLRNATEAVAMGVQGVVDSRASTGHWVILKVDMTNAFNTVSREAVLRETQARCPSLFNYLRFCYQLHAPLFCGGQPLSSQVGGAPGMPHRLGSLQGFTQ